MIPLYLRHRIWKLLLFTVLSVWVGSPSTALGKKIKTTFKIEKPSKDKNNTTGLKSKIEGKEIILTDSLLLIENKFCNFSGYDKEAGSNNESFILTNSGNSTLSGFKVKIDYLDLQKRMLHSREVIKPCLIPPGESRRIDIKSWDTQHVYYYYLGNEPRRVATPYMVEFHPMSIWIQEN